jgi:hypothetical protein
LPNGVIVFDPNVGKPNRALQASPRSREGSRTVLLPPATSLTNSRMSMASSTSRQNGEPAFLRHAVREVTGTSERSFPVASLEAGRRQRAIERRERQKKRRP